MARALKSARPPRRNKTNMASQFQSIHPQKLYELSVVGQTFMRGDNVKLHRLQVTIDLHKSKLYVKTKQKFSTEINSFASKADRRKIVEVNGEWKLYKENKEISTLTLKEAMLPFLAFGSRSVERSERSSQFSKKH